MGTLSHFLHTGPRPIGVHEFAEALRAICPPRFPPRLSKRRNPARPVGLAVSGGVDSMALAYLCSQLKKHYLGQLIIADNPVSQFRAFVIDHGLREGSNEEARAVVEAVKAMGIRAVSMALQWTGELGSHQHPKELPNFESVARRLRYRKLGTECGFRSTNSLLFAHHEDDQYETVLMRLLQGHGVRGLRGMRTASDIPECENIHGVHRSGFVDDRKIHRITRRDFKSLREGMSAGIAYRTHDEERRTPIYDVLADNDLVDYDLIDYGLREVREGVHRVKSAEAVGISDMETEDGGIVVYRPLLQFPKDRLIATCEANKVPWWEDNTNQDPTLTMRNAVRHMCKTHALPVALQKPSILALARRCEQKAQVLEAEASRLLAQTIIHKFGVNVGTVSVQFPDYGLHRFPRDVSSPSRRRARLQRQREVAGLLIKKIIALVSPGEQSVPVANLQNVIPRLFPALPSSPENRRAPEPRKAFAIADVHIVPIEPSPKEASDSPHAGASRTWHLSRAPYPSNLPMPSCRSYYWYSLPWNTRGEPNPDHNVWTGWMRWKLWDGRFWVRLRHRLHYRVVMRPFLREHAKAFRERLAPADREHLAALLKRHAPGKARYTLPALYHVEEYNLDDAVPPPSYPCSPAVARQAAAAAGAVVVSAPNGQLRDGEAEAEDYVFDTNPTAPDPAHMRLVALPSLGVEVPGLDEKLQYEIRYRRVDRATLDTAGTFFRGPFASPWLLLLGAVPSRSRSRTELDL
ncbi:adenine nucleotide alpha hydrolases-like protein [Xylaria palmicola]|nr:adenine nucleotide alpha hydrolases-like protein [Xylaria palmicola]